MSRLFCNDSKPSAVIGWGRILPQSKDDEVFFAHVRQQRAERDRQKQTDNG
jgi:hypothetical protein